ncbi:MAG: alkyl sulfatase, partial [Frankia sp.]
DLAEQTDDNDEAAAAQIVLTVRSDDLIALTDGSLPLATAWASGRLKVAASVRDLLRVRSLL